MHSAPGQGVHHVRTVQYDVLQTAPPRRFRDEQGGAGLMGPW
ncbi:hypothetical protein ACFCYX_00910 [Streptomyces populi]